MAEQEKRNLEKEKSIESGNKVTEAFDKVDSSSEISDLMEGVEGSLSEDVSEKKETKSDGVRRSQRKPYSKKIVKKRIRPLPSTNVMRRKVLAKMRSEEKIVKRELRKAKSPVAFESKIKEIRGIRQKIADFLSKAKDAIKDIYLKFFGRFHGKKEDE